MFDWRSLVSMFAAPLGSMINRGISVAATAVVTWSIAKGVPGEIITPFVAAVVLAVSSGIGALATSQGIQIPLINKADNGVKVVAATNPSPAVNAPLK